MIDRKSNEVEGHGINSRAVEEKRILSKQAQITKGIDYDDNDRII
jgi:hypothetical protein